MFENGYRFFYTQKVTYSNPLTAPNVDTQSSIVAYSYSLPCHIHSTDGRFEFQVTFLGDNFKYSGTYRANGNYFTRPRFHQVSEISQLLTSINNGASVKVCVENQYFELHNVSVDSATVSGMSVWEIRDKNDGRSFNDTFQRVYRIFNQRLTENSMEGASYKWYTTEQQSYERRTNLNLTWFVDTCWDVVYENKRVQPYMKRSFSVL
ncbi:uncharacterized protein LOC127881372 isoform X2 [Dreissena polymorpha]|uniref:uncharacterized protein LOC127881372 isoform X1 n=1 Tax=Dreissena polymorpha TaxID=45954 RepID=UPI002264C3CE|nr:uncharacterized protein LOC127881372 isoform X1 [Dreissena polymorpha]XP_052285121.1 uncharacterized protein LOC127881372 isoform X2 [Dreissena polymorpha]